MMKDQQNNTSKSDISINLSVNNTVVKSKSDGQNITSFRVERFELNDSERLKLLFQQNVHSINMWDNPNVHDRKQNYTGHCKTNNYQGVFGVALDYDDGTLTLKQAREEFKDYIHLCTASELAGPFGSKS